MAPKMINDPCLAQLKNTFKFMGIHQNYFYQLESVGQLTNEGVEKHLEKIFKLTDKLIG